MRVRRGKRSDGRRHPERGSAAASCDCYQWRADACGWAAELESKSECLQREYLSKLLGYQRSQVRDQQAVHGSGNGSESEERLRDELVAWDSARNRSKHVSRL